MSLNCHPLFIFIINNVIVSYIIVTSNDVIINHQKKLLCHQEIFSSMLAGYAPIRRLPFKSASFSSPLIPSSKLSLLSSHGHNHHQYCFKCEFWWNLWEVRISRYPCRKLTYCSGNNKFILGGFWQWRWCWCLLVIVVMMIMNFYEHSFTYKLY